MKSKTIELTNVRNLCEVILEYNVEIHTTSGTVDTTDYNLVDFNEHLVYGIPTVIDSTQDNGSITIAYSPNGERIGSGQLKKGEGFKAITIPFNTINSFTIKSRRNFLMNQVDMKQPQHTLDEFEILKAKVSELEKKVPKIFPNSNRSKGMLEIPSNGETIVLFWEEINVDFGVGAHINSAMLNLNTVMKEITAVQATGMGNPVGQTWDDGVYACAVINNGTTVQIKCSKGGQRSVHVLVIGKK